MAVIQLAYDWFKTDCVISENGLLLSAYNFIVIPIKYHNFGAFVYGSTEKQMLNAISLVIEQRKNEFDTFKFKITNFHIMGIFQPL